MRIPLVFALSIALLSSLSCDDSPPDDTPFNCNSICLSSAGTYHFLNANTGDPAPVSGTISITLKDSETVLLDQPLDGGDTLFARLTSIEGLTPYENGTAPLTVTVQATGFQDYVADIDVSFRRSEMCGSYCLSSDDEIDVRLIPE